MNFFKRPIEERFIWKALLAAEECVVIAANLGIAGVVGFAVYKRYLTDGSFFGFEEICTFLAMWLYFIGGAYCSYKQEHIDADMITSFTRSERLLLYRRILIHAVSIFVLLLLTKFAVDAVVFDIRIDRRTTYFHMAKWLNMFPIAAGFFLMLFYECYHLIRLLRPYAGTNGERRRAES